VFRPALAFVLAAATVALAQPGAIQRGKVVRSNPDGPSLTLTVDGKDREFFLTPDTKSSTSTARPPPTASAGSRPATT